MDVYIVYRALAEKERCTSFSCRGYTLLCNTYLFTSGLKSPLSAIIQIQLSFLWSLPPQWDKEPVLLTLHVMFRAMEMNLTGVPITAEEASQWGLVSRIFPAASLVEEAVKSADKIASHSKIITQVSWHSTDNSYQK